MSPVSQATNSGVSHAGSTFNFAVVVATAPTIARPITANAVSVTRAVVVVTIPIATTVAAVGIRIAAMRIGTSSRIFTCVITGFTAFFCKRW